MTAPNAHWFTPRNRKLYRSAIEQGWIVSITGKGHARFVPPKGQSVVISNTENAIKPNICKLEAAGLKLGEDKAASGVLAVTTNEKVEEEKKQEVIAQMVPSEAALSKIQQARAPVRGELQGLITLVINERPNHVFMRVEVLSELTKLGIETTPASVDTTLATLAMKKKIKRVGPGKYSGGETEVAAPVAAVPSPSKAEPITEDEEIINDFLGALGRLQELAFRIRERSEKFNELRKLLGKME